MTLNEAVKASQDLAERAIRDCLTKISASSFPAKDDDKEG